VGDALAWALYRAGRPAEALRYERRSLALGMRNALLFFHAGMIERTLGDTSAARRDLATALRINPNFSILHSEEARRVLASLGGSP
jgi:tetratricopeptide (TPR) repeat protein